MHSFSDEIESTEPFPLVPNPRTRYRGFQNREYILLFTLEQWILVLIFSFYIIIVRVILELTMLYTNFNFQLRLELCAVALCS